MKRSTDIKLTIGLFLFSVFGGGFSLAGAIFNFDWFMNDARASFIIGLFGRDGARIFYGGLGLLLIGIGVFSLTWLRSDKTK